MSTQVNIRVQLNTIHHSAAVELSKAELEKVIRDAIEADLDLNPKFRGKFSITVHGAEVVSLF
jgi:hypothetical protein